MPTRRSTEDQIPAALLYYRVSDDIQEREGQSLAAQLADCRRYAAARGWAIAHEHHDVMSGKRNDRPSYQALLADARRLRAEGQQVVVVVKWLHRLGRRLSERVRCWEELGELGVRIHSVAEGGEQQELVFNVLAAVAQEESRQIGERISSSWRHIRSQGWPKIGRIPWGYRLRPATAEERSSGSTTKVLEIDPVTAPFVTEAYRLAALPGSSSRQVARWVARLPGEARGDRTMPWRVVHQVLLNPLYVARPLDGHTDVLARPVGKWPPLVSDEMWAAVDVRFKSHKRIAHQASRKYLLTGLIRCRECGLGMRGEPTYNGDGTRYRCYGSMAGTCQQSASSVIDRQVLDEVLSIIDGLARRPSLQSRVRKTWAASQRAELGNQGKQIAQLEAQVQRSRQRIARATELLVDGTIEKTAYDVIISKSRADAENAQAELKELGLEVRPAKTVMLSIENILSRADKWAAVLGGSDVGLQRDIVAELIEEVVATRQRQNVYTVDITWTAMGRSLRP